ncbi:hypothetical protein [Almyronema epifaneia]|uniref:Uncharacterized protein n=1 Tax=Almyronema epifaneia S1 TaxID=2991925 RepID=A0ABW6IDT6_9CYAN
MDVDAVVKQLSWIERVASRVWVVLTLMMLASLCFLVKAEGQIWQKYVYSVLALIAMVWLYPLYTFGFRLVPGLIGNIAVGLLAAWVVWFVSASSAIAAYLIVPVIIWLSVATVYVILLLLNNQTTL